MAPTPFKRYPARMVSSICVYGGARPGDDPAHREAAASLGKSMAAKGIRLVFGGGSVGLMGVVADAVLAAGGHVTGVIPTFLDGREITHRGVTELLLVASMHERKQLMFERADAFIALPGGFGTLDELFEMITWRQLGRHEKPIVLLDVKGFYAPLVAHIEGSIRAGFVAPDLRRLYGVAASVEEALALSGVR